MKRRRAKKRIFCKNLLN